MQVIRVLLIEDDRRLARHVADYLRALGLEVGLAHDGPGGTTRAMCEPFDCIVLDLMLPGRDGLDVCRAIRGRSAIPIAVVSARSDEADRLTAFEAGADDFLVKPCSSRELYARIRALVRRARGELRPAGAKLQLGGLVLDPGALTVSLAGEPVHVTPGEFALLYALAEHHGQVLSRERLLELAKRSGELAFDRAIDVQISRLRSKLGSKVGTRGADDGRESCLIRTVRGVGYVLDGNVP